MESFFLPLPVFSFFLFSIAAVGVLGGGRTPLFAVWGCMFAPGATFASVSKSTVKGKLF